MSVRNYVPVMEHRISFDLDFNPNSVAGYSYGKVSDIKKDLDAYGSVNGCGTRTRVTNNSAMLYFLEIMYRDSLRSMGAKIVEPPKIEICKTCRTHTEPVEHVVNTIIDTNMLGLDPPKILQLSLEEQLANKLHVIGAQGRQRNNFDAYDAYCMFTIHHTKIIWKSVKKIFERIVLKSNKRPSEYIENCRRHLDTMLENPNKRKNLESVALSDTVNFEDMIQIVKSLYIFKSNAGL